MKLSCFCVHNADSAPDSSRASTSKTSVYCQPCARPHSTDDAARLAERKRFVRYAMGELLANHRDVVVTHDHNDLVPLEIAEKFLVNDVVETLTPHDPFVPQVECVAAKTPS